MLWYYVFKRPPAAEASESVCKWERVKKYSNFRFIDVVSQWPGSTHDNTVFENCGLKAWLHQNPVGWLLGDAGYALKPYVLTPKARK